MFSDNKFIIPSDHEKFNEQLGVKYTKDDIEFINNLSINWRIKKNIIIHSAINTYKVSLEKTESEGISNNIINQREETPSFLFTNTVTNNELYAYLKKNPTASKFIFNKYKNNRDFIKELCDPSNPIYLEMVAENLKEIFKISEVKEDIGSLKKEQFDLQQNVNDLKKTLEENTKEYDSLESKISNGKQELDNIQKQISNLREEDSLKRIKSFYKSVDDFIASITEAHDKLPIESIGSLRLDIHQINLLKLLQKGIKSDLNLIENIDLLSEEMLDAKRKEIKEQMKKEMEEAEKSMNALQLHNPVKILKKSVSKIQEAQNQLDTAGEFSRDSGWFYNIHTIPNIHAILDIPKELINNLVQQINNVNARKAGSDEIN